MLSTNDDRITLSDTQQQQQRHTEIRNDTKIRPETRTTRGEGEGREPIHTHTSTIDRGEYELYILACASSLVWCIVSFCVVSSRVESSSSRTLNPT